MRVVLQRVSEASVTIEGSVKSKIGAGILILLGIENADNEEDIIWLCNKISKLRIFNDEKGLMNLSNQDIAGSFLVISQFTLHASTKKGNRPSYIYATFISAPNSPDKTGSPEIFSSFCKKFSYNGIAISGLAA